MKQASPITSLPQACPEWAEKLNALHRDDLPFEERMALRKHLDGCSNCRAVKAEYRALDALITDLPVEPLAEMPARLRELTGIHTGTEHLARAVDTREDSARLVAPVRKQQRSRRLVVRLNLAAAALVVGALVAGFLILHSAHPVGVGTTNSSRHNGSALGPQHNTYLNVIIGNAHGDSYAVDPYSGDIVWKHQVMTAPSGDPFSAYGILYYTGANGTLYAIDGGDGQPLWHTRLAPNQNYAPGWTFVASDGLIFATTISYLSGSGVLYALDAYTGAITWQKHMVGAQDWLVLAAANGVLYGAGDGLYAWSTKDGHQIWHDPQFAGLNFSSSQYSLPLVVAHGKIYFFPASLPPSSQPPAESAQIKVVDASNGHLLHTISINTPGAQPEGFTVGGNTLYAAVNSGSGNPSVQAYSLSDDHRLWQKTFNGRIVTLSATDEQIYVGVDGPMKTRPSSVVATGTPGTTATITAPSTLSGPSNLVALKSSDGSQNWIWVDPAGAGLVAAIEINGVVCVVDGGVTGVRASDGHKLWQTSFSQATGFHPVVD